MIQLLFLVIFVEGALAFPLLEKIGLLRDFVIKGLDQLKMGKGSATVKTITGTMPVILLSSLMSIVRIRNKGSKLGTMSPMDQVLWRTHLLEASLMGFTLFLEFIVDRMHHYLRKLMNLRSHKGASKEELEKLQEEKAQLKVKDEKVSKEIKQLKEEISVLSENLENRSQNPKRRTRVETAEAPVASLQKQAADLLLEYDRLLEGNQTLQAQLLALKS